MECRVTVSFNTLYTGPLPPPTNVAREFPPRSRDLVQRVYWLQEDWVTKVYLRDPQRAQHVHPPATLSLFECTCNIMGCGEDCSRIQWGVEQLQGSLNAPVI